MKNLFSSAYFWLVLMSIAVFALYGYGHYTLNHNMDFFEGGATVALASFVLALNLMLISKILGLEEDELGKLKSDKAALVSGLIFAVLFSGTGIPRLGRNPVLAFRAGLCVIPWANGRLASLT